MERPEFRANCISILARVNANLTKEQRFQTSKEIWANPEYRLKQLKISENLDYIR